MTSYFNSLVALKPRSSSLGGGGGRGTEEYDNNHETHEIFANDR